VAVVLRQGEQAACRPGACTERASQCGAHAQSNRPKIGQRASAVPSGKAEQFRGDSEIGWRGTPAAQAARCTARRPPRPTHGADNRRSYADRSV
jgi:hypothetical protein